ncbi:hypothetical protein Q8A67_019963 [Cirrhinus molitorella]|uniref:Secreted protein n=1 Tax=Cirrhinus molitorella TaxID=172907 RepID=A0AA88PGJ2_9TELE|nr:hypothetical protein Q8A67_019963 [Cirrhinus molitorella]
MKVRMVWCFMLQCLSPVHTACEMSLYEKREDKDVKAASPEPSCVSMKSDRSVGHFPDLSDGVVTSDPEVERDVIRSVTPHLDCQTLIRQRVKDQHKNSMKNKRCS